MLAVAERAAQPARLAGAAVAGTRRTGRARRRICSVDGCTVSPRKSRRKSACFSSTDDANAGAREQQAEHHAGGPAADDHALRCAVAAHARSLVRAERASKCNSPARTGNSHSDPPRRVRAAACYAFASRIGESRWTCTASVLRWRRTQTSISTPPGAATAATAASKTRTHSKPGWPRSIRTRSMRIARASNSLWKSAA